MNISIIIPVFNEAENIERNLSCIDAGIHLESDCFSVHIVYNQDTDNTLPVIEKVKNKYSFPVTCIKNEGRGVCEAIKTGLQKAEGEFVLVTMADMCDDYHTLPQMVEKAREGYDVVCASRYMKGGQLHGGPFFKQLLSRWAGVSLHYLTRVPTHDITNSYKLYRKSMLNKFKLESNGGFEIGMEITAKAFVYGYRISEVPTQWWDREKGQSRFKLFSWIPKYLRWYFFLMRNILAVQRH